METRQRPATRTCRKCGKPGHYAKTCISKTAKERAAKERRRKGKALHAWKPWSEEDEAAMTLHWNQPSRSTLKERLRRTWRSIIAHAGDMGLEIGPPQGYVFIATAARIVGYERSALVNLAKRYGVIVYLYPCISVRYKKPLKRASPGQKRRRALRRCVELDAIVRVAEIETKETEPVYLAAKRLKTDAANLRRLLAAAGEVPKSAKRGSYVRVRTEVSDRVVREWRERRGR